MQKKNATRSWLGITLISVVVVLPFIFSAMYKYVVAPDPSAIFAGGTSGGRYDEFARSLVKELNANSRLNRSRFIQTAGSYDNLELLKQGKADFALFQSGSDSSEDLLKEHKDIFFVSNVFPEVTHLVVRKDVSEEQAERFDFTKIAIGSPESGDYRVGMALVTHFHLDRETVNVTELKYGDLKQAFQRSEIELAILTVGVGAEIVQELIQECECRLIRLPTCDAFLAKHVAYFRSTIPHGSYISQHQQVPSQDLETVAVNAQLVTRKGVSSGEVQELLKSLNQSGFLKKNHLRSLFVERNNYATRQPEFPLHQGASIYYDPNFRPLLNPDFVEATEGIRSFIVSALIGVFFLVRWLRVRAERSQAHRLDHFIHRLLAIEQEQMPLDGDYTGEQITAMESFLDEITNLRREALLEFTAHELKDDPAIECFIAMSHGLSQKINSKLTRDSIRKNSSGSSQAGNGQTAK